MHRSFAPVVAPIVEAVQPRVIVEVGAGFGRLTRRLLDCSGAGGATVHAIDPQPGFDPNDLDDGSGLQVHRARSVAALSRVPAADLALLDGDPNWYTVHAELELLATAARTADAPPPVVVVNNVHWPFGRRDGYYDPSAIPEHARQPHVDGALAPTRAEPGADGLRLVPFVAERDFGARNGVLTAVEDFVAADAADWTVVELPGHHGVAVLVAAVTAESRPGTVGALVGLLQSSETLRHVARRTEAGRIEALIARDPQGEFELPKPVGAVARREAELVGRIAELELEVAEAVRSQAKHEAASWRLEALQQDLAARDAERKEAVEARDAQARAAVEATVRLERALEDLEQARTERDSLQRGAGELRATVARQQERLDELADRARLLGGRASHLEESLGAAQAEARRARGDALTTERRVEEVSRYVRAAAESRAWRLGHWITRMLRLLTFRPSMKSDGALEVALRALDRPLLPEGTPSPRDARDVAQVEETA